MNQNRSLVNWFSPQVDENDEDKGQRAVRDTQDTVEVMLLHKCDDEVHLMPWVGMSASVWRMALLFRRMLFRMMRLLKSQPSVR